MRLTILLSAIAVGLTFQALADETVTTADGRQVLLRSDGTYEMIDTQPAASAGQYKKISLEDLKLDIDELDGQSIEVKAKLMTFGDMVMLGNPKSMFDSSPVVASQDNLSREERRRILRCESGCNVTVRGEVGQVMFQSGILIHSLQK